MAIRKTRSVCPVCLAPVGAKIVGEGGAVYMEKTCEKHGDFRTLLWRGFVDMDAWRCGMPELAENEGLGCPNNCGICHEHKQGTCCVVLEVTRRCNLRCRFCFAHEAAPEIPIEELYASADRIFELADPTVQLSGGEPTVRDDLPELISYIKNKGARFIQLNSNGIRLAEDAHYCEELAEAGLSYVFLQFDGVDDSVYEALRGRPLYDVKMRAIENCGRAGLGVTLVPTVVRGVNDGQIGDIVSLAAFMSPIVRGVHFQPVSYIGHYPDEPETSERYTLDELINALDKQAGISPESIAPSRCDHPLCGFHGQFTVSELGELVPRRKGAWQHGACSASAERNRDFVGKHWSSAPEKTAPENADRKSFDYMADRLARYGLTISAMAFQDAGNLDIERLMSCSLHVYSNGRLRPFCAHYLTAFDEKESEK